MYGFVDKKNSVRAKIAHTGLGFYIEEVSCYTGFSEFVDANKFGKEYIITNFTSIDKKMLYYKMPIPCYEVRGFMINFVRIYV